jgi:pimeloyl-ACP methyl ester carboxylesterase
LKLLAGAAAFLLAAAAWIAFRDGEAVTLKAMGENRLATSRDGTTIAYTKMGTGPAVVLVDGAFCYRENGPAPTLAPLLAEHFTVFTYDRRGRGESGDTQPYAIAREIEDLGAIVDQAGGSSLVLGVSSGAALAMQAVASGVNISRLALYEPPFVPADNGRPTNTEARTRLEHLLAAGDRRGAVKYFLGDVVGVPRPFLVVMPLMMRTAWNHNISVAHTLPYDLTILDDWSALKERRASIPVPTLVIGGGSSPAMLKEAVTTVTNALPNARSRFLEGQTHNLSAPVLAPVVREFFAER